MRDLAHKWGWAVRSLAIDAKQVRNNKWGCSNSQNSQFQSSFHQPRRIIKTQLFTRRAKHLEKCQPKVKDRQRLTSSYLSRPCHLVNMCKRLIHWLREIWRSTRTWTRLSGSGIESLKMLTAKRCLLKLMYRSKSCINCSTDWYPATIATLLSTVARTTA